MLSSVSVIGVAKQEAPMAACFAASGFTVHAVDVNPQKLEAISRGVPPVHEPGLAELLAESGGRLSATNDIEAAVSAADATFVVVATPSEPDGGFSLRYAIPTCESIGGAFGLCYNPEFIALGTVIRDFYHPDFLLIGESDSRAGDVLSELYKRTCKNTPAIARMNWINAEITKLAVNTYS